MTKDTNGKHLTGADEFKALKLIEANGKTAPDGCFVYNTGWSDWKIATEIGCQEGQVARRRKDIFGNLRRTSTEASETSAEIEKLTTQAQGFRVDMYRLTQRVEAIEKAINLLLTAPVREGLSKDHLKQLERHFNDKDPARL